MSRRKHLDKSLWENILGTIIIFGFIGIVAILTVTINNNDNQIKLEGEIIGVFKTNDSFTVMIKDSENKIKRAVIDIAPDTDIKIGNLKQSVAEETLRVGDNVEVTINASSSDKDSVQGIASLIVVK